MTHHSLPIDLWTGVVPLALAAVLVCLSGPGDARAGEGRPSTPASGKPGVQPAPAPTVTGPLAGAAEAARAALRARLGENESTRIERGVGQVALFWRPVDGDGAAFAEFVESEFLPAGGPLDATFDRLEFALERLGGHFVSLGRDLRRGVDLEIGPMLPIDRRLADYDPGAHFTDDMFQTKVAFVTLLNFPLTTLPERLAQGMTWSRRQWAETRLAQRFSTRVPAEVNQRINGAYVEADSYINAYNIYMHHLLATDGSRPFPAGLRLITHWGLRDELKARYADRDGLPKQRLIQTVMDRIVRQEIPAAVIDNPLLDWAPGTNRVTASTVKDAEAPAGSAAGPRADREADERYRRWLGIFRAVRLADPYHPDNPTHIDRRFNVDREIPEAQVKALFEEILRSPLGERVGRLIKRRLGRRLEPFDIWYAGFKPRSAYEEPALDAITRTRYPSAPAYAADIPRMLKALGFGEEQARFLAEHIEVDPSRGAGHALGAARRDDRAHLRTRIGAGGMDYKGYNIAVHEMGHNVEQVFSLNRIDHTLLQGVPNTAFTEALAFVFQARDLELLGLVRPDRSSERSRALEEFWATREIAGVALVDMAAWRWLYAHPEATPAEFRQAVVDLATDVWNRHYAPIFKTRDVALLAVYSHMVDGGMYTPDYPLGHLIAFQVEAHFRTGGDFGAEFERLCRLGSITPDAWMRQGVGGPLSAGPLLEAASEAVAVLEAAR